MRLVATVLWALLVVGCSEVTTPLDTVEVGEAVQDMLDQTPIAGAKMCQTDDAANCEISGENGFVALQLPINQKLSYTIEKEGYGVILIPVVTPKDATVATGPSPMEPDEWLADNFQNLGSNYPLEDKGAIHVRTDNRFAGLTLELVGATGTRFYTDEEDNWRLDLEATTSGAYPLVGGFVDVVPGDHQVEIGGTAGACGPIVINGVIFAWPGDSENRFEVPVQAGVFTRVFVRCPVPF